MKKAFIPLFMLSAMAFAWPVSAAETEETVAAPLREEAALPSDSPEITEFSEIEEPLLIPEEHLTLSEALEELPDSLQAFDETSGEWVSLPVDWECLDDYNDPSLASFVFQAVPCEEGILLSAELPKMEIYYPEEGWVTSRSANGLATSVQTLSDESIQGDLPPEEELAAASYASLDHSFWDSLDFDEGFQYTKQQQTFLNRVKSVLEKYLYENAIPEVTKDTYSLTETISFKDLSSLYYDPNNKFAEDPNCVTTLLNTLQKSHPQYFFTTTAYSSSQNGRYLRCVIMPRFAEPEDRNAAAANIQQNMESILKTASYDAEKDTARYLHDAVCKRVIYDSSAKTSGYEPGCEMYEQSLASVFYDTESSKNRYTICAGYSQAYTALCNYKGIPAFSITSKTHQWNKILLDGFCYTVDTTWDDGNSISTTYFLREELDLINQHQPLSFWFSILKADQYSLGRYGFLQVNYTVPEKNASIGKAKSYTEIIQKGESFQTLGSSGKESPAVTLKGYVVNSWKTEDGSVYLLNQTYQNGGSETRRLNLSAEWLPTAAPTVSEKTITLNLKADSAYRDLLITPPEGTVLSDLALNTEKAKCASYLLQSLGSNQYRILLDKSKDYKTGKDTIFLQGSYYIYANGPSSSFEVPITVSLIDKVPSITLKALSPANLYLKEARAVYQVTSSQPILNVSLHEENTGFFSLESFDTDIGILILQVENNTTGTLTTQQKKVRLIFTPDGYNDIEKTVSVSTTKKAPVSLQLKNALLTNDTVDFTGLLTDKATLQPYRPGEDDTVTLKIPEEDQSLLSLEDFDNGYFSGTLLASDKKSVKTKLQVENSAWVSPVTLSFTVKTKQKTPAKLSLGATKATLISSASVSVPIHLGGSNAVIENLSVLPVSAKDSFSSSYAAGMNASLDWNEDNRGYVDALLSGDSTLGTGTAKVFFQATVAGKTVKSPALTIAVVTAPALKVSMSGALKASDPYSKLQLTPKLTNLKDAHIDGLSVSDSRFRIVENGGFYFLMAKESLPKGKITNLMVTADITLFTDETVSSAVPISFSVK